MDRGDAIFFTHSTGGEFDAQTEDRSDRRDAIRSDGEAPPNDPTKKKTIASSMQPKRRTRQKHPTKIPGTTSERESERATGRVGSESIDVEDTGSSIDETVASTPSASPKTFARKVREMSFRLDYPPQTARCPTGEDWRQSDQIFGSGFHRDQASSPTLHHRQTIGSGIHRDLLFNPALHSDSTFDAGFH